MFNLKQVGKFHIQVCKSLMCALVGSDTLIGWIKAKLGIGPGETTPDGAFTLSTVECLAACGTGPMMQINEDYYERADGGEARPHFVGPQVDRVIRIEELVRSCGRNRLQRKAETLGYVENMPQTRTDPSEKHESARVYRLARRLRTNGRLPGAQESPGQDFPRRRDATRQEIRPAGPRRCRLSHRGQVGFPPQGLPGSPLSLLQCRRKRAGYV